MGVLFNRAPHTAPRRSLSSREVAEQAEAAALKSPSMIAVPPMERLIPRDLPYHQSSNCLRVRHQMPGAKKNGFGRLRFFHWYVEDWFHVLLRFRTIVSILLFVTIWTFFLILFALIYVAVDGEDLSVDCGLGQMGKGLTFHAAFAFSLETSTTVGYGLPNGLNGFFENCPSLQVAIYFQMLFSMFFNAFLLSFIFARVSRSERRASQVLFSDKAILNREILPNGIKRFMLSTRIYDADSMYPIVEAHVRFYAVKHRNMHAEESREMSFPMKMEPMRVSIPNDDLGAVLYTSIPTTATHHVDYHSPLLPPLKRKLGMEDGRVGYDSGFVMDPCGMNLRENDTYTGGQDGLRCVICGETYNTVSNLIQHIRYNQHTEKHDGVPVQGSHQELDVEKLFKTRVPSPKVGANDEAGKSSDNNGTGDARIAIDEEPTPPWYDEYQNYLRESNVEIICVVEAIDPIMSGTFQALQSYTVDDIAFDADFAPCVLADVDEGTRWRLPMWSLRLLCFYGKNATGQSVKIDLDSFHRTVKLGEG